MFTSFCAWRMYWHFLMWCWRNTKWKKGLDIRVYAQLCIFFFFLTMLCRYLYDVICALQVGAISPTNIQWSANIGFLIVLLHNTSSQDGLVEVHILSF